jgi:hypothetical protein
MAITDINISETLEAGAPSIKYTGNRDPNQMMASQPGGTENILVAGGGDRGWRAQMLAEDLAQEQYGKEFYDLSHDQQMEIYNIALDMIDTGGMATGGRVGYGLGSLVKKIGKGIKKIVKSPVGKAAILGAAAFGIPGTSFSGIGGGLGGFFGKGSFNPLKAMISSEGFTGLGPSKFGQMLGKMGTGSKVGIGTALATYLGSQGMEEEQIDEIQRDPNKLRPYLRDLFKKLNPSLPDGQIEEMVETNVSEYATGGRVGLYGGTPRPSGGIETLDIEDEEIITPDDLKMEEGVQIGPMASYDYNDAMAEAFDAYKRAIKDGIIPPTMEFDEYLELMQDSKKETAPQGIMMAANGGRIGYSNGGDRKMRIQDKSDEVAQRVYNKLYFELTDAQQKKIADIIDEEFYNDEVGGYAQGGRIGLALGSGDTAQAASILGNLPLRQNSAGITELDLRETGGFIPPVGVKEKADDVPAMLSNNEFVFTADAVRAAGGGSVNKGAQILYDKMKQLESKVV